MAAGGVQVVAGIDHDEAETGLGAAGTDPADAAAGLGVAGTGPGAAAVAPLGG